MQNIPLRSNNPDEIEYIHRAPKSKIQLKIPTCRGGHAKKCTRNSLINPSFALKKKASGAFGTGMQIIKHK
jgi:hypothetical protein